MNRKNLYQNARKQESDTFNRLSHKFEVTFIYDICSFERKHTHFSKKYLVANQESVREYALLTIQESFNSVSDNLLNGCISNNQPIVISLDDSVCRAIQYDIGPDGAILFLSDLDPLNHDWTFGAIFELADFGYLKGNKYVFRISTPGEFGGGGFTGSIKLIYKFLQLLIALNDVSTFICKIYRYINLKLISRELYNRGLRYPRQLREFFDLKSVWMTDEIKKRLPINSDLVYLIMSNLGYEQIDDKWKLATTEDSAKKRQNWLKIEKEIEKIRLSET